MSKYYSRDLENVKKYSTKDGIVSELGVKVVYVLGIIYSGLHHCDDKRLNEMDWKNNHHIIHRYNMSMSTVDYNDLTRLVVVCHDECIRAEIAARSHTTISLMFHHRKRSGDFAERCPTLEEHIDIIRNGINNEER